MTASLPSFASRPAKVAALVALAALGQPFSPTAPATTPLDATGETADIYVDAEVAGVGLDRQAESPVVVLQEKGTGRLLPIWVGFPEAQAIALVLEGITLPRPMTHDLLRSVFDASNLVVNGIQVEKLEFGTYHASITGHYRSESGEAGDAASPFRIDSRPSDAIALALRLEVPIRVSETLLIDVPDFDFAPGGRESRFRALGMEVGRPTEAQLRAVGLPVDGPGLVVLQLSPNAAPDIQVGDIITEANGEKLPDVPTLVRILQGEDGSRALRLKIHRGDEVLEKEVPLIPPSRTPETTEDRLEV